MKLWVGLFESFYFSAVLYFCLLVLMFTLENLKDL
jgi:hypothetical protein